MHDAVDPHLTARGTDARPRADQSSSSSFSAGAGDPAGRMRFIPRLQWPDYLFPIVVNYPNAVDGTNRIVATQLGARLLW
jgi:hypothetical protein